MEQNFEKAFKFLMKWEGGYVNNPQDPGGETKYGISKKSYPDIDIPNLTIEQAKKLYHEDYWRGAGCEMISSPLDIIVFDTAVNCGVRRALYILQKTHDWRDYLFLRLTYYLSLSSRHFIGGWINRVVDLWQVARGI